MVAVISYIPDKNIEHFEAINTMSCCNNPRVVNDGAAAGKPQKRFDIVSTKYFHCVWKLQF